jgi:hypothetical protein
MTRYSVVLAMLISTAAAGEWKGNLSFEQENLLRGDYHSAGVGFRLSNGNESWSGESGSLGELATRRYYSYSMDLKGVLTVDPDANSEPIVFALGSDLGYNLVQYRNDYFNADPDAPIAPQTDYGRFALGMDGGIETDQRFDTPSARLGVNLRYVHMQTQMPMLWIPNLTLAFAHLFALKEENEGYSRWTLDADWDLSLDNIFHTESRWVNHSDLYLRLVRSEPVAAPRYLRPASYAAVRWTYDLPEVSDPWLGWVDEVYLHLGVGRLDPIPYNETQLRIGLYLYRFGPGAY